MATIDDVRHECGHLVVAKALGFNTGQITLMPTQASAALDVFPSSPTLKDVEDFIERRVMMLYAGAAA
jgi:hypothetical protein